MTRALKRTSISAKLRVELLQRQGHKLNINGSNDYASVTVVRTDGQKHTATVTPEDIPDKRRNGPAFKAHPQSMLIAQALHAVCDWSAEMDRQQELSNALAVDPSNCVCVLCQRGEHIPLNEAVAVNIAAILVGKQRNNTGHDVELSVEYVMGPGQVLKLTEPPRFIEARILDTDMGMYRRFNISPWWPSIINRRKA